MKEQFVPYELAVKLKQLGFDEPCLGFYERNQELIIQECLITDFHSDSLQCVAPLLQQAFRWFRENYLYHPHFFSKEDGTFVWCIRWYIDGLQKDTPYFSSNTYEEAELACLDKLIEIVELKQQKQCLE
jgi:hypothetical protein